MQYCPFYGRVEENLRVGAASTGRQKLKTGDFKARLPAGDRANEIGAGPDQEKLMLRRDGSSQSDPIIIVRTAASAIAVASNYVSMLSTSQIIEYKIQSGAGNSASVWLLAYEDKL